MTISNFVTGVIRGAISDVPLSSLSSGGATPTLRNIATRCRHNNQTSASYTQMFSRTLHINRGSQVMYVQVVFSNWYAASTGEFNGPGTATITAAVEYPYGFYNQLTFGGSTSGSIVAGVNITSDTCWVAIPPGARFWVRSYYTNASGIVYSAGNVTDQSARSAAEVCQVWASGGTDYTVTSGGTNTPPATGAAYFPTAILGMSNVPSVVIYGDSRTAGSGDTPSTNVGLSGVGEIGRSLDALLPYTNVGCGSDRAAYFNTPLAGSAGSPLRTSLAPFHTHAHVEYGTNDLTAGALTTAQLEAQLTTMYNALAAITGANAAPIRVTQSTISPVTTSTDSWATTVNQTQHVSNPNRTAVNDWIRSKPSPLIGYAEVADAVETARNSGIWKSVGSGETSAMTADGTHETSYGYNKIVIANAITSALFS